MVDDIKGETSGKPSPIHSPGRKVYTRDLREGIFSAATLRIQVVLYQGAGVLVREKEYIEEVVRFGRGRR